MSRRMRSRWGSDNQLCQLVRAAYSGGKRFRKMMTRINHRTIDDSLGLSSFGSTR